MHPQRSPWPESLQLPRRSRRVVHQRAVEVRALSPRSVHDGTPVVPYWAAVPWANVQQRDQPEKWDRQVLLVLPQAPKKVEETLGQWLAQSVSKNRNMARFLLPKARASGFSRKRKRCPGRRPAATAWRQPHNVLQVAEQVCRRVGRRCETAARTRRRACEAEAGSLSIRPSRPAAPASALRCSILFKSLRPDAFPLQFSPSRTIDGDRVGGPVELARVGNGGTTVSVVVPVYNSARRRWCADSARWASSGRHVDHRDRRRVMISM